MWCPFVPASIWMWSVSLRRARDRPEELLREVGVETLDRAGRQVALEDAQRPAGDVDDGGGARLVHRHGRLAVARDPAAVAERLVERLPEDDPDVLDRVVRTGLQVAARRYVQVERAVARERVEHVVEEPDARRPLSLAAAVQPELEPDVGLVRLARDVCGSGHARRSIDSPWTGKPSARARAAPCGARARAASSENDTRAILRRKVATDSPLAKRAAPPVGRTWFEPGHVVAERGARGAPDEQASRRADLVPRAPPHRPRSARGARARSRPRAAPPPRRRLPARARTAPR